VTYGQEGCVSISGQTSTEAALIAGLGERRLAELRARGAVLEHADVVAYLRAEALWAKSR